MKILFATDGSEFSKKSIEKIASLVGAQSSVSIKAISVFETFAPMAAEPFAVSADYYRELEENSRKRADAWAEESVADLKKAIPSADVSKEVSMGAPSRIIIETAKEWGADLIVVGSHGRGFWGRVMLGSVSDAVLHHAPCSVLVVR
jgi:nucleotide-binding universal stress UspA family protein